MQAACDQYSNVELEGTPVGILDREAPDRSEPGVHDELVRASEDRDRVELHGSQAAKHRLWPSGGPRPD